jgi:Rrf2 family nitric oxide-sensitive transcriptional repressor
MQVEYMYVAEGPQSRPGDGMKLTRYTDYALRVLMHLAARPERLSSISEIARSYGISQNHLMKVVHDLRKEGYVAAVRGRAGGVRLARPPAEINIGEIVRHAEEGFDLVECGSCVIAPACGLTGVLGQALGAFMRVLDGYTLADLVADRTEALLRSFGVPPSPPPLASTDPTV